MISNFFHSLPAWVLIVYIIGVVVYISAGLLWYRVGRQTDLAAAERAMHAARLESVEEARKHLAIMTTTGLRWVRFSSVWPVYLVVMMIFRVVQRLRTEDGEAL